MNINDVATQISTTSRLITMVALSTCDTGKWHSLEKWASQKHVVAFDPHNSSFNYEASGVVGQQNCESGIGIHQLRQTQRRLTAEQVIDVCQKYREGATVYELGKEYGIDRRTVSARLKEAGVSMRRTRPPKGTVRRVPSRQ